ncbi:hypothetical protein [Rhodobacter sp. CZR27]|uniref:hypothetical protein n=1 Tax=Rhodobacter sp. CZR27 TaxID=2033869 RepID=UPI000BBEC8D6|nr:hypothetical protein [Rhodobacter sp. CZR27]
MGYSAVELDNGAACLAGMAGEARRRAGSNYLLDNRWFPPTAYVREEAGSLEEGRIRAVILMPAGKGWIVDILLDGVETEAVFPSLPAFVRDEAEARDKAFICLCALYQTIFARRVAEHGDGGLPTRPFDLMGHTLRVTGGMQVRAGLLVEYFGATDDATAPAALLRSAAEPFVIEGRFSTERWLAAKSGERALVYFHAAALLREGVDAMPLPDRDPMPRQREAPASRA